MGKNMRNKYEMKMKKRKESEQKDLKIKKGKEYKDKKNRLFYMCVLQYKHA